MVLIESDWNLKQVLISPRHYKRICINRIRLEFKVVIERLMRSLSFVLIESDWNLKEPKAEEPIDEEESINRIRLEFKDNMGKK